MKFLIPIFLLCVNMSFSQEDNAVWNQISEVNPEWNHHHLNPDLILKYNAVEGEKALLKLHLSITEAYLREKNLKNPARSYLLDGLKTYIENEQYPINTAYHFRQPCFIDEQGHLCAVAHLMYATGDSALAKEIALKQPYFRLKNMTNSKLNTWVEKSGFSIDELALIQPGYDARVPEPRCGKGFIYDAEGLARDSTFYEGECSKGVLNGKWIATSSNGWIREKGQFKNGKPDGDWVWYNYNPPRRDEEGRPIYDGNPVRTGKYFYKNGELHGEFLVTEGDFVITQGRYENGNRVGKWMYNDYWMSAKYEEEYRYSKSCDCYNYQYESEERSISGQVKNGMKIGHWIFQDTAGKLINEHWYELNDIPQFDSDDYWTEVPRGKRVGEWKDYNQSIDFWTIHNYSNDQKNGYFTRVWHGVEATKQYQRGTPYIVEGTFKNDLFHGDFKISQGDQLRDKGQYHYGKKYGKWTYYFSGPEDKVIDYGPKGSDCRVKIDWKQYADQYDHVEIPVELINCDSCQNQELLWALDDSLFTRPQSLKVVDGKVTIEMYPTEVGSHLVWVTNICKQAPAEKMILTVRPYAGPKVVLELIDQFEYDKIVRVKALCLTHEDIALSCSGCKSLSKKAGEYKMVVPKGVKIVKLTLSGRDKEGKLSTIKTLEIE